MADKYEGFDSEDDVEALKEQLVALVKDQRSAEQRVEDAQEALTAAQKALDDIAEHRIPEVMDKLGKKRHLLPNGIVVSLDEKIRAGISKANEAAAFAWLRSNGHASLIKREVKLLFGKGEDERAAQIADALRKQGLAPEEKTSVHPQTLGATIRELMKNDKPVPLEVFGVVQTRRAKIG